MKYSDDPELIGTLKIFNVIEKKKYIFQRNRSTTLHDLKVRESSRVQERE